MHMEAVTDEPFSEAVMACLPATPWCISDEEIARRRDLRASRCSSTSHPQSSLKTYCYHMDLLSVQWGRATPRCLTLHARHQLALIDGLPIQNMLPHFTVSLFRMCSLFWWCAYSGCAASFGGVPVQDVHPDLGVKHI